ncbi:medium chain dehydrogenase/reductase family protein [Arthrobacter cryoconiti]|uniref:Medium chain dehydrogenase/reductase family protein n=1 Tax=Arthrobacter cryoconiti TaxID=748907 RepID=A0ABV8R1J3_9MICC|nr:medium chain dehydrogenase/reductase family protein [Arthrobacter cryoconiti]MCC9067765.1 medium chain dehydrogenase/reductase family protein [Arthrobacter cryoconiti]
MTSPTTTLTDVVLPGVVLPDGLIVRQLPMPCPAPGQVLIKMLATGVSFAEQQMRRNRYPGQPKFPFVPGYDIVGIVTATGNGCDEALAGRRVAAVIKTGGWSTHVLVDARDVVLVPDELDAAEAESVVVNGVTAWQMLHRKARVKSGDTILVHGANGGVGSTLVQLARNAGVHVIGTASPRYHAQLRELGVEPIDYNDPDLGAQVRQIAPGGVDAVFDHLGEESFKRSFNLLSPGGTLVAYGTAAQRDETNNINLSFLSFYFRLMLWTLLPNRRRALFFNFWEGKTLHAKAFRGNLSADLTTVLGLLVDGKITANVAARIPLREANRAMTLAESKTVFGKVVLIP